MPGLRLFSFVASTALATAAAVSIANAEPPKIARPYPAPEDLKPNVPPLPNAEIDNGLAIGGDQIDADRESTRLSVAVKINGTGPYQFIVDSGADTSAVGMRIARNLQLPLGTQAILNGMTSRDIVDRVRVDELSFGHSAVRNLEVPALKEVDLGGSGLLGIDALVKQRLSLDFEENTIKVEDASTPYKAAPGEILIVARRQHGQLILTQVKTGKLRLDAVIDTGSEITIGNLALRRELMRNNRSRFLTVETIGVTGKPLKLDLARVNVLQIGSVTLRDIPMAFADVPPFKLFGLEKQPAILLGTDMLEHFRKVSLDFKSRKVRFQLRRCTGTMVTFNSAPDTVGGTISGSPDACLN